MANNKKIGLVVLANNSGLGNQTRRLAQLIKPDRLLAINSQGFSKNKKQNWHWYDGFSGYKVDGFPSNLEVRKFLSGLTHVLVCENPMNHFMLSESKHRNIRLYIQSNYEFCDHLNKPLALPYKFLMPSFWKVDAMQARFGDKMIEYLPPPIDPNEFKMSRIVNFARTQNRRRFLHIVGTLAANDRNGTLDLLEAVKIAKTDFELVIHSQHALPPQYMINDQRVRYRIEDIPEAADLYRDFDAVILPRRYGGLSLTTNEALMSGLPVIMTDISPNDELLPKKWLVTSRKTGEFMTRTQIDIFSASHKDLARKIDEFVMSDIDIMKSEAFDIAHRNFSFSNLRDKYEGLWLQ